MINIYIILGIIFLHWVFDFIFQSDFQAKNKSSNNFALTSHICTYTIGWAVTCLIYMFVTQDVRMMFFPIITFICHWIQDYYTSRWVKKSFDKQDYHNGFVKIGFDQFLHYTQMFLTYLLLR